MESKTHPLAKATAPSAENHFWLDRRGVPTRERRDASVGVTVVDLTALDPGYLRYLAEHLAVNQGCYTGRTITIETVHECFLDRLVA